MVNLCKTVLAMGMAAALCACGNDIGFDPLPDSCVAGQKRCYLEPVQGRTLAVRCNAGEVQDAVWLIDQVCDDETETCQEGICQPNP